MAYFRLAFYSIKERDSPVRFDTGQSNSKETVMFDDLTPSAAFSACPLDLGLRTINNPTATTKTTAAAPNHGHPEYCIPRLTR